MTDSYLTIGEPSTFEPPRTKASRFIGEALPAQTAVAAMEILAQVRRREHAATHHCWAYRLKPSGDSFRYSDDGEPSGSAGLPIYRAIEGRELTNVLVVVTRYYGGTKLGTGGLARAYGEAAEGALTKAPKREVIVRTPVQVKFGFEDTSPAMHVIGNFDVEIAETAYSESGTEIVLHVRCSEVEAMSAAFVEALRGRVEIGGNRSAIS